MLSTFSWSVPFNVYVVGLIRTKIGILKHLAFMVILF